MSNLMFCNLKYFQNNQCEFLQQNSPAACIWTENLFYNDSLLFSILHIEWLWVYFITFHGDITDISIYILSVYRYSKISHTLRVFIKPSIRVIWIQFIGIFDEKQFTHFRVSYSRRPHIYIFVYSAIYW